MKHLVFLLFFASYGTSFSQEKDTVLVFPELQFSDHLLQGYSNLEPKSSIRGMLGNKDTTVLGKINPLRYIAGGMLFVYQNVFSEQISANCTYEVSCSQMTKLSIEKFGLIKGSLIGLHQLSNCNPSIIKDHEAHMISAEGKVINSSSDE